MKKNWKKTLVFSIICNKRENEDEKIFKEEESIEVLKLISLFKKNIITLLIQMLSTQILAVINLL